MRDHFTEPDDTPGPAPAPAQHAGRPAGAVAENLRDHPGPGRRVSPPGRTTGVELWEFADRSAYAYHCFRTDLVAADAELDRIHEWVMSGRSLPGPWREHCLPRGNDQDG
ncbi:hypothetical protein [Nocardiopsis kunsanensis]|uniref:Uncharacterized protein n=1 Tax=Nocardiopsis kunsanensis TaxID=141693 RepID=A0A919CKT9_9ACTN|nr:hypothetical protein [Nocardiopsis kunsanensis]GHD34142.1 hypothetical protein GCM10007147_39470 [Nocardiopsis kunsanensis]